MPHSLFKAVPNTSNVLEGSNATDNLGGTRRSLKAGVEQRKHIDKAGCFRFAGSQSVAPRWHWNRAWKRVGASFEKLKNCTFLA
jgi:hypothetical protein